MTILSGDFYEKQRWLVQTFGGVKRGQCGQDSVLPPLKRQRRESLLNGGAGFNGFPAHNHGSQFHSVSHRNQRSVPIANRVPQLLPANKIAQIRVPAAATLQNTFPKIPINLGVGDSSQSPILGLINPNSVSSAFIPSIQQIANKPLISQIENPNPSPPLPTIGASLLDLLGSTINQDFRFASQTLVLDSAKTLSNPPILNSPPPLPPSGSSVHRLLSSLVHQGLIKPTEETQSRPESKPEPKSQPAPIGLEFNPKLLNKRNESVINALYPEKKMAAKSAVNHSNQFRQCSTCGIRFKTSGEHSRHMDWHLLKNRAAKGKIIKPSRRWFPNPEEIEAASAVVPESWLTNEVAVDDKRVGELLVVHADYDQKLCALCNEEFEDFYCDSTEDWMYKGAVYMNSSDNGNLGPIVHAKCHLEGL